MKVLFLVDGKVGDKGGGGAFFRIYQNIPMLRKLGLEVEVSPSQPSKYYFPEWIPRNKLWGRFILCFYMFAKVANRFWACLRSLKYDLVFLYRDLLVGGNLPFLEFFLKKVLRKKIVFDFDDAVFTLSKSYCRKFRRIVAMSDGIIVGNNYLKEYASKYNRRVIVIPGTVDTSRYLLMKNIKRKEIIIGWIGLYSNFPYLEVMTDVLHNLCEKYPSLYIKVVSCNFHRLSLPGVRTIFKEWSFAEETKDVQTFDIGIMPLPNNEWTQGKCGGKLLVYLACGLATISSRVCSSTEIVQDGINGFLASTKAEWEEKLSHLIENKSLRE
ncbi:glycosyltransferase family 4 protein, partial [bacterium]|nr:glycosyltransferase family 4 protein [bacterium]